MHIKRRDLVDDFCCPIFETLESENDFADKVWPGISAFVCIILFKRQSKRDEVVSHFKDTDVLIHLMSLGYFSKDQNIDKEIPVDLANVRFR